MLNCMMIALPVSGDDAEHITDENARQNITNSSMQTHARQLSGILLNVRLLLLSEFKQY